MERKFKSIKIKLPPTRLYLDDLRGIIAVLKEKHNNINIETDDYKFLNIDELQELGNSSIKELEIGIANPYIRLSFRPYWAELYLSEDNLENRGLASKIVDIIQKRRRKRYFQWINLIFYTLPLASSVGIYWITDNLAKTIGTYLIVFLITLVFAIVWLTKVRPYTIILLKNRKDDVRFYVRNKDKIILTIFGAMLGAGVTMLVQIFIHAFLKNK